MEVGTGRHPGPASLPRKSSSCGEAYRCAKWVRSGRAPRHGVTVSEGPLVATPPGFVTVIFAVTAGIGTVNVTSVGDAATTTACTAPTFTTGSTPPAARFVPLTTTVLPRDATGGSNPPPGWAK
jgi:hypothetical protein